MGLDDSLDLLPLVAGDNQEPPRVIANGLVDRWQDVQRRSAGGVGALTEKLDRVVPEFFAEQLEPLVHLPEGVLVQRPSLAVSHVRAPGLARRRRAAEARAGSPRGTRLLPRHRLGA
jgi:hypothetical protein